MNRFKRYGLGASIFMLIVSFIAMRNSEGPVERPLAIVCFAVFVLFTAVNLYVAVKKGHKR